jgi:2-aminoadipate transaminase
MIFDWTAACAGRAKGLRASEIRTALNTAGSRNLITLAGGVPAAELYPTERFREAFARVLRDGPRDFLQYGSTEGHPALRELIASRLSWCDMRVSPDRILVTNGSQQGIDLAARLLLEPGSHIVVDDPSYVGAIENFQQYQAKFTVVPSDDEGLRPDVLEHVLRVDRASGGPNRIRMLYIVPNFANPSGTTMSLARRQQIVDLSHRFGLPIVEDDAYGELRYDGAHIPSLASLDDVGTVIYLGTFSKILSPGVRIGWMVGHPGFIGPLTHLKERVDLHSATGAQQAVCEVASDDFMPGHLDRLKATYRERRDTALAAAMEHFPTEVTWRHPAGGYFLWCSLPSGMDSRQLLRDAMTHERVVFVPGDDFFANGTSVGAIRLSYSAIPPAQIAEGVRRIGLTMHAALSRSLTAEPAIAGTQVA